jgi:translation initiation factor 1
MKENLFEMGSGFGDGWTSDNKTKEQKEDINTKEPQKHRLYFAREKRNGKIVTIVKPFSLDNLSLEVLLKTVKKSLATGGTIKDDTLEFQGEVQEKLKIVLEKLGYGLK